MDLKEIRQLIKIVESSEINELEIEEKDNKIRIVKTTSANGTVAQVMPAAVQTIAASASSAETGTASEAGNTVAAPKKADNIIEIKSPMVGTFYSAPSPDSDPYTEVGKSVKAGDVLCIVEAMKLMNEIESEYNGKIVEILVDNAQPVEYNQVLFLLEKA